MLRKLTKFKGRLTLSDPAFSVVRQALGVAQRRRCQNPDYHQLIYMTFCMSQYSHESMADAEFESGSFSSFRYMTSQNFRLKRGTSHKLWILTPENGFNFEKN